MRIDDKDGLRCLVFEDPEEIAEIQQYIINVTNFALFEGDPDKNAVNTLLYMTQLIAEDNKQTLKKQKGGCHV